MVFTVQDEMSDREYNPPMEWYQTSRAQYKLAKWGEDEENDTQVFIPWNDVGELYRNVIKRLEDPKIEGAGLERQGDGGIWVEGVGETGYDVSMKSEDWRRGYYECLLGAAKAAEYMEDMVRDRKTMRITPKKYVLGPSNPDPRPVPPDSWYVAAREEDTEVAFEAPEVWYMRILTSKGFTQKQYVDAAIAYAAFLDYKGAPETALEMYSWAMDFATSSLPAESKSIVDPKTGIIDNRKGLPSLNVINVSTALGVYHASHSNLSLALPIFLSVLRARRSLPQPPPAPPRQEEEPRTVSQRIEAIVKEAIIRPPPPPLPTDGTSPPERTPQELCEEAGLMTYVGEILYAAKTSKTSKEDGLAWTREAVDISEEQLTRAKLDKQGKKVCKQCLGVAVRNWDTMVSKLAKAEREERKSNKGKTTGGWLGFGGEVPKDFIGRWESEEFVVRDRMKRASDLL